MLDTSIQVRTDNFDGPLALLLLLIQKEQMNIRELDITRITKEYLNYLEKMHELNFNIAGDYLFLASTLLFIKSKTCISNEEILDISDEFDNESMKITSQAELIRRLEELERFQEIGRNLWKLPKKGYEVFVKAKINRKDIVNSILTPIDLSKLTLTMIELIARGERRYKVIERERISIKDKLEILKKKLVFNETYTFVELLETDENNKMDDIIITFISTLELARLRKIQLYQNEMNKDIYVKVVDSMENFDVNSFIVDEEQESEDDKIDHNMTTNDDINIEAVEKLKNEDLNALNVGINTVIQ